MQAIYIIHGNIWHMYMRRNNPELLPDNRKIRIDDWKKLIIIAKMYITYMLMYVQLFDFLCDIVHC